MTPWRLWRKRTIGPNVGYHMTVAQGPWTQDTTERLRARAAAYALYALSKSGRANLGELRYLHDARMEAVASPLARAHLGAALAAMGGPSPRRQRV